LGSCALLPAGRFPSFSPALFSLSVLLGRIRSMRSLGISVGVPLALSIWSTKFLNWLYTSGVALIEIRPPPSGKLLVLIALSGGLRNAWEGDGPSALSSWAIWSIHPFLAADSSSGVTFSPASANT